jgi:hypothetical protein
LQGDLDTLEQVKIYKADRVSLDTESGALDVSGEVLSRQPDGNTRLDVTLHPSCLNVCF